MNIPCSTIKSTIIIAVLSHIIPLDVTANEIDLLLKRIISLDARVSQLEQQTSKAQPQPISKDSSATQIIGAWKGTDGTLSFFSDGRLRMVLSGDRQLNGSWVILHDGRLKIEVTAFAGSMTRVGRIHFDNTELILAFEDSNVPERYKRIP